MKYTEAARRELREAVQFLRDIDPILLATFAAEVERTLSALRAYPHSAQETDLPGVRRSYIRRFRYFGLLHNRRGEQRTGRAPHQALLSTLAVGAGLDSATSVMATALVAASTTGWIPHCRRSSAQRSCRGHRAG